MHIAYCSVGERLLAAAVKPDAKRSLHQKPPCYCFVCWSAWKMLLTAARDTFIGTALKANSLLISYCRLQVFHRSANYLASSWWVFADDSLSSMQSWQSAGVHSNGKEVFSAPYITGLCDWGLSWLWFSDELVPSSHPDKISSGSNRKQRGGDHNYQTRGFKGVYKPLGDTTVVISISFYKHFVVYTNSLAIG